MQILWGRATSVNVQKVMWALAELGLTHERIDAGGKFGGLDTPEFGALNPMRQVPVWQESGLALSESHAIVRHLVAMHPDSGIAAGPVADQLMEFTTATLQPAFIGTFWQAVRLPAAERSPDLLQKHLAGLHKAAEILDTRLAQSPFLAGPELSTADIAAGSLMFRYFDMEIERPNLPALERWYALLSDRPPFQATIMTSYDDLRG